MSIVAISSTMKLAKFAWGQLGFDLNFAAGDVGAQQSRVLGPPRWTVNLMSPTKMSHAEATEWSVLVLSLRRRVNQLALYYPGKPAPLGTARGAWTANATANAGASSIVINAGVGQAGKTLLAGDWVGVNQASTYRQLLHVQADATVDGAGLLAITFEPVLRVAVAGASSMAWDKPTALFRRTGNANQWSQEGSKPGGYSLDLAESWE